MTADTPIAADTATVATPSNSPSIIQKVFLTPIDIPSVMASVMHMPGVKLTRKKVGIKARSNVVSIKSQ